MNTLFVRYILCTDKVIHRHGHNSNAVRFLSPVFLTASSLLASGSRKANFLLTVAKAQKLHNIMQYLKINAKCC